MRTICLFSMIILLSCGNEKNDVQKLSRIPHTDSTFQNDSSEAEVEIELLSPEECFIIETISESEYNRLFSKHHKGNPGLFSEMENNPASQFFSLPKLSQVKNAFWEMEKNGLKNHKIISRKGDQLKIKGELRDRILTNKYGNLMEEYPDSIETNFTVDELYLYDGKLSKSGIDAIVAYYYEGSGYMLVDAHGKVIDVPGNPVESPDGNSIFCTNTDLVAGFSANGYCFLRKDEKGNLQKICEVLPQDYGLNNAVWISDSEIAAEKETIDENMESTYTFVKIKLKVTK